VFAPKGMSCFVEKMRTFDGNALPEYVKQRERKREKKIKVQSK
jgi:hypothetical protein